MRKAVFPISSTTRSLSDVSPVDPDVPLAQLSTTAPLARTQPSIPEEEFVQTVPILALLVTELELVPPVSADSTTSKVPVSNPVPMEPIPSTESANVNQESFLLANV